MSSGLRAGPYELLTRLSGGGMGEVFVARRTGAGDFEKEVALKLLLPHLVDDSEFVERFFDEARLAARMNHPNIIQIFDVGEADGRPYLAMALVEGVSLSVLLRTLKNKRLLMPLPLVRLIATGLLEALGYAHGLKGPDKQPLNVVHRDVSPSNVMISTAGAVLLTDFGIAKAAINLHYTRPGSLRGKAAYIAPEQSATGPVSPRADVFSASTLLYESLTLVSPFKRGGDLDTIDAVRDQMPTPAQLIRSEVGQRMSDALMKAHAKDAAQRFATAREFREAFVDGPVASAPELAEFIKQHCAEDLRQSTPGRPPKGTGSLMVTPSNPTPGTTSLPDVGPPVPSPEALKVTAPDLDPLALKHSRSRVGFAVGAVVLVLALAGAAFVFWPATPQVEVAPPPQIAEVPKVEPPVEVEKSAEPPAPKVDETKPDEPKRAPLKYARKDAKKPPPEAHLTDPAPLKVGYLTADAAPWARVLLDGKELDQTPLSRFPVPIGRHTVLFRTQDGRVEKRPVVVEEGKVVTLQVDFSK
ncbi:MAG: protein kinase [Myxococcaceae bacterium]